MLWISSIRSLVEDLILVFVIHLEIQPVCRADFILDVD